MTRSVEPCNLCILCKAFLLSTYYSVVLHFHSLREHLADPSNDGIDQLVNLTFGNSVGRTEHDVVARDPRRSAMVHCRALLENRIRDFVSHMLRGREGRLAVLIGDKLDPLEQAEAADVADVRQRQNFLLEQAAEIFPALYALSDPLSVSWICTRVTTEQGRERSESER